MGDISEGGEEAGGNEGRDRGRRGWEGEGAECG